MTTDRSKAIVRRFFEEVINQGRIDVADELFAPNFSGHGLAGRGATGPEGPKRAAREWRAAFPDIHFTVNDLIAEGERVVVHVTLSGTHHGTFMGVAPTGRRVTADGVELARLAEGRIVEEGWHFMDELGLLRQLGALAGHRPGAA
jgi:predicted ester cyclase